MQKRAILSGKRGLRVLDVGIDKGSAEGVKGRFHRKQPPLYCTDANYLEKVDVVV